MKKYLLLILTMLSVSIGAWAYATGTQSGPDATYGYYTFDFSTGSTTYYGWDPAPEYLKILGTPTVDDVKGLIDISWNSSGLKTLDISSLSNFTVTNLQTIMEYNKWFSSLTTIVLPKSLTITESEISTLSSRVSNLQYLVVTTAGEGGTYTAEVKVLRTAYGDPAVTNTEVPYLEILGDANCTSISIVGADDIKGSTDFGTIVSNFTSRYSSKTVTSNANPFNIENGCEVTLRRPADATTMASLLADIKTTLGSTNICKLKITGTLSNADLAALGNAAVAGATRLDLSEATLAAGADITNLKVPATLTSCLLPVGCVVEGNLLTTFSGCSNLEYVVSPTDSKTSTTTADYVYVSKAGGLASAFTNESAILHTAKWIKIESTVALNTIDLDIASLSNDYKPTVVDVLDFSGANINPTSTASLQPHGNTYRVILPDNWSADDMAVFYTNPFDASESNFYTVWGNIAAFYSYSGTALNILGVSETYSPIALCDKRIVRTSPATTAVNFVRGAYKSKADGTTIQYKGKFTASMLKAINNAGAGESFNYLDNNNAEQSYSGANAGSTITSVTVAPELALPNACTFDNNNLRSINLSGVNNSDADVTTSGCANLQILLLNNATVKSVTANNSSLESVGLNNVTIGGDLSFQNSQMVSFVVGGTSTINGNIDLSYTNNLTYVDVVGVTFANLGSTDIILTRKKGETDESNAHDPVYDNLWTSGKSNVKVSNAFADAPGEIVPNLTPDPHAPFNTSTAGVKQVGCYWTINLDKNDTSYDDLAEVLNDNHITEVCNLTINTLNGYKLDSDDIDAINGLTFDATAESDVTMYRMATLNLDGAEVSSNIILASLAPKSADNTIRNIILPRDLDKNVVNATTFNKFASTANFNGAVSLNAERTQVVGYVKNPGSLRTILYQVPDFRPNVYQYMQNVNLPSVTLSGTLNAADIASSNLNVDTNGNYQATAPTVKGEVAFENLSTLRNLDIKDAVFVDKTKGASETGYYKCDNMTLSELGWGGIVSLKMPTNVNMTEVPARFLRNCQQIRYLCIPYNYKTIGNEAFYLAGTNWITTTDGNGAEIDNGINTYTFSKNLKQIGTDPGKYKSTVYPGVPVNPVFGAVTSAEIHDIYFLSSEAPKCWRGAFASGMTYGWGGFDGGNIYCREKYKNGAFLFTVLNFPQGLTEEQEKKYTDITKVYTKKDQTGAVDANGETIPWPTFSELGRSYNQAIRGLVWDDWTINTNLQEKGDINGGTINFDPTALPDGNTSEVGSPNHNQFYNYVGLHEFVLSKATYVAPDEVVDENNEIKRYYKQDDWYTFCIPFDMTEAQVAELLGVPASETRRVGEHSTVTYNNYLQVADDRGNAAGQVTTAIMPQIVTLKSVLRNSSSNTVTLYCSKDLASGDYKNKYYMPNATGEESAKYQSNGTVDLGEGAGDENIVIRAGYPYMIRPYVLCTSEGEKQAVAGNNLGKQVLTRYTFKEAASGISNNANAHHEDCFEAIGGQKTKEPSKFAKPYENHKVQAYSDAENSEPLMHGNTGKKYNYTFIGQFWKQFLPLNSFYMSNHTWYHYTVQTTGYYWNPYLCIIMVSDEDSDKADAQFRTPKDNNAEAGTTEATILPEETGVDNKGHAVFDRQMEIRYRNGLSDLFTTNARMYQFVFEDDIMDFEPDGQATAIEVLDGVRIAPVHGKVYNMAGQQVGNSLEGLSKGMYIVNGKKYVIK